MKRASSASSSSSSSSDQLDLLAFPPRETARSALGQVAASLARLRDALLRAWHHRGIPARGQSAVRTQRLGSRREGFHIAPARVRKQGLAYCAGLSEDLSFELDLLERFELSVYVFDPTPRSADRVARIGALAGFYHLPVGLAGVSGSTALYRSVESARYPHTRPRDATTPRRSGRVDVRTIPAMMKQLGHDGRPIDVLKLDIDGAEFDVLDNMIECGIRPGQVIVTFHHRFAPAGLARTRRAVNQLRAHDYDVAAVEGAVMTFVAARELPRSRTRAPAQAQRASSQ